MCSSVADKWSSIEEPPVIVKFKEEGGYSVDDGDNLGPGSSRLPSPLQRKIAESPSFLKAYQHSMLIEDKLLERSASLPPIETNALKFHGGDPDEVSQKSAGDFSNDPRTVQEVVRSITKRKSMSSVERRPSNSLPKTPISMKSSGDTSPRSAASCKIESFPAPPMAPPNNDILKEQMKLEEERLKLLIDMGTIKNIRRLEQFNRTVRTIKKLNSKPANIILRDSLSKTLPAVNWKSLATFSTKKAPVPFSGPDAFITEVRKPEDELEDDVDDVDEVQVGDGSNTQKEDILDDLHVDKSVQSNSTNTAKIEEEAALGVPGPLTSRTDLKLVANKKLSLEQKKFIQQVTSTTLLKEKFGYSKIYSNRCDVEAGLRGTSGKVIQPTWYPQYDKVMLVVDKTPPKNTPSVPLHREKLTQQDKDDTNNKYKSRVVSSSNNYVSEAPLVDTNTSSPSQKVYKEISVTPQDFDDSRFSLERHPSSQLLAQNGTIRRQVSGGKMVATFPTVFQTAFPKVSAQGSDKSIKAMNSPHGNSEMDQQPLMAVKSVKPGKIKKQKRRHKYVASEPGIIVKPKILSKKSDVMIGMDKSQPRKKSSGRKYSNSSAANKSEHSETAASTTSSKLSAISPNLPEDVKRTELSAFAIRFWKNGLKAKSTEITKEKSEVLTQDEYQLLCDVSNDYDLNLKVSPKLLHSSSFKEAGIENHEEFGQDLLRAQDSIRMTLTDDEADNDDGDDDSDDDEGQQQGRRRGSGGGQVVGDEDADRERKFRFIDVIDVLLNQLQSETEDDIEIKSDLQDSISRDISGMDDEIAMDEVVGFPSIAEPEGVTEEMAADSTSPKEISQFMGNVVDDDDMSNSSSITSSVPSL